MCSCGGTVSPARARPFNGSCPGGNCTEYTLLQPDGTEQTFGSRLEADAENARLGYIGIVKPNGAGV